MDLAAIPIKVATPTGDTLYRGDETFTMEAGRELLIRETKGGQKTTRYQGEVPAGKVWSVRIHMDITETDV